MEAVEEVEEVEEDGEDDGQSLSDGDGDDDQQQQQQQQQTTATATGPFKYVIEKKNNKVPYPNYLHGSDTAQFHSTVTGVQSICRACHAEGLRNKNLIMMKSSQRRRTSLRKKRIKKNNPLRLL